MIHHPPANPIVLVVEDEVLIRLHAVEVIEDAGFEVLEAGDADQAILLLESHPDICIVFTDIHMPGSMDGLKLLAAIRDRWPPIKLIATSGHFRVQQGDLPEGGRFISKPYGADQITDTLHAAMRA